MKFDKFTSEITNLFWLNFEPGSFISFSKGSGKASLWNVSKKSQKEIFKISDSSIIKCCSLPNKNELCLLSLESGGVQIYNFNKNKVIFSIEPGHSETIFDLKFSPFTIETLATCSFDAHIKIWNVSSGKIIQNINTEVLSSIIDKQSKSDKKKMTNIYCLQWSPTNKDLLATGDSEGYVKLWNISKPKLISYIKISSNINDSKVIGLDWIASDKLLATCIDSVFLITTEQDKLKLEKTYKCACLVFSVKFNPFNNSQFSLACDDKTVKIFNLDESKPINILNGHSKKVFGIQYNQNKNNTLASTSDDNKIGIWNLPSLNGNFLTGHTDKTRQVIWLSNISNILISGSWDGTIRIWNTDLLSCIGIIDVHYSDVYGLDISPHSTFLLSSCSRDNSIRFFDLSYLAFQSINYIINYKNLQNCNTNDYPILQQNYESINQNDFIAKAEIISNYFFVNNFIM